MNIFDKFLVNLINDKEFGIDDFEEKEFFLSLIGNIESYEIFLKYFKNYLINSEKRHASDEFISMTKNKLLALFLSEFLPEEDSDNWIRRLKLEKPI